MFLPEKVWRQKLSAKGHLFSVFEDLWMPRIHDDYLDCVIYLYHSREDAERAVIHNSGGSGFLVAIPFAPNVCVHRAFHLYAVSNRHVIEGARAIRLNTKQGQTDILEVDQQNWFFTQDQDVAVYPVKWSDAHSYKPIFLDRFITKDTIQRYKYGPGNELFMVGRFVNHEGKQRNFPSVRFGNLNDRA